MTSITITLPIFNQFPTSVPPENSISRRCGSGTLVENGCICSRYNAEYLMKL